MREPCVSWRRQRGVDGDCHVLVLTFDHGVALQVAGELALRLAHWSTRPDLDPDLQRQEVARALEWGRAHDDDIRALFKRRVGAASLRPASLRSERKTSARPPEPKDELRRA
jgi:hypothetical protein